MLYLHNMEENTIFVIVCNVELLLYKAQGNAMAVLHVTAYNQARKELRNIKPYNS